MRTSRLGLWSCAAGVASMLGIGCSSSSDDSSASPPAASGLANWSETSSALGVTSWGAGLGDDQELALTGYDDAHAVRSQFVVARGADAAGNVTVRIRSTIQGPAVLEYRTLADGRIAVVQDSFRDHADAKRALELAVGDVKVEGSGSPLTESALRGLHTLDTPLVGDQGQLVCVDDHGNACQTPPSGCDAVLDCVAGAVTLGSALCHADGAESLGASCLIGAGVAVTSAVACFVALHQRSSCTCSVACQGTCTQRYDKKYACAPGDPTPCTEATTRDRAARAKCTEACTATKVKWPAFYGERRRKRW